MAEKKVRHTGKSEEQLKKEEQHRAMLKKKADDRKIEKLEANKKDQALRNKMLRTELTVIDKEGVAFSTLEGIREVIKCGAKLSPKLIEDNCFTPKGIEALIEDGRVKEGKVIKEEKEKEEKEEN